VALVLTQENDRLGGLIPVRRERMTEDAFAFYRAGAELMAMDLASTPRTGVLVQASGDAHVSNFGWYGSPERDIVFDTNDFDETMEAAWEWDVKRLAASFVIAGRDNGFKTRDQRKAARASVRGYQKAMRHFADMPVLDLWYTQMSARDVLDKLDSEDRTHDLRKARKAFRRASTKDSHHVLGKVGERIDGEYRIIDDPPFVVPIRSADFPLNDVDVSSGIADVLQSYSESLGRPIRTLMARFDVIDVALKVVGVGSVGTKSFIVMLQGNGEGDVLFLQLKEANRSVLEDEFGDSAFEHDGKRVVEGQRLMQTTSDVMLGWTTAGSGTQYYVRQLKDMKASADLAKMAADDLSDYAKICGAALANAHARSGDSAVISGYIGSNGTFADAVSAFAVLYAGQNEMDYRAYLKHLRDSDVS